MLNLQTRGNLEESTAKPLSVMRTVHTNEPKETRLYYPFSACARVRVRAGVSRLFLNPVPSNSEVAVSVLCLPRVACQVNLAIDSRALEDAD